MNPSTTTSAIEEPEQIDHEIIPREPGVSPAVNGVSIAGGGATGAAVGLIVGGPIGGAIGAIMGALAGGLSDGVLGVPVEQAIQEQQHAAESKYHLSPTHEQIAERAWSYYAEEGHTDGHALSHWLRAERELSDPLHETTAGESNINPSTNL